MRKVGLFDATIESLSSAAVIAREGHRPEASSECAGAIPPMRTPMHDLVISTGYRLTYERHVRGGQLGLVCHGLSPRASRLPVSVSTQC